MNQAPLQKIKKPWYQRKLIIILAILILVFVLIRINNKIAQNRQNRAIINFCEEYAWDDSLRGEETYEEDGIRVAGQGDFMCSEHLGLKPKVKKSNTGICHEEDTTYYYKTKDYRTFNSIEECLDSGGRKPYN